MKKPLVVITARDVETERHIVKIIERAKKAGLVKDYTFFFTYVGECRIDSLEAKIIEKARKLAKEIIKEMKQE